ncbi:capsule biosynthesis protein [Roseovarius aquimarinus]|uniref:Capsule biosynthesis protein n=1 Tax=Roseovarius aquimarinus TaxID=1229156 RepID=A0ABW7I7B8_9RHOB
MAARQKHSIENAPVRPSTERRLGDVLERARGLGFDVKSGTEAVRVMLRSGRNPFYPAPDAKAAGEKAQTPSAPVALAGETLPRRPQPEPNALGQTGRSEDAEDAAQIEMLRGELAEQGRRRALDLAARLGGFILLPTLVIWGYLGHVATPLYATDAEFLIIGADSRGAGGSGMFGALAPAGSPDAIAVQSYLMSKDAMLRLDADAGYRAHFSRPDLDYFTRVAPDAPLEDLFDLYARNVTVGFDPTEGVIRMEVRAADAASAQGFAERLISYAEERVDSLSARKRADAVASAEAAVRDAEAQRRAAQTALLRLQQSGEMLDPDGRVASLRSQITSLEVEMQQEELRLAALLDNPRPQQARVDVSTAALARMQDALDRLLDETNRQTGDSSSLAQLSGQIQLATADLEARDRMLQAAIERLDAARIEADAQARYLTVAVQPVRPEIAAYPKVIEGTLIAFLIFSGLYVMGAITVSIVRELVSA